MKNKFKVLAKLSSILIVSWWGALLFLFLMLWVVESLNISGSQPFDISGLYLIKHLLQLPFLWLFSWVQ
jgi:hypothetical protein